MIKYYTFKIILSLYLLTFNSCFIFKQKNNSHEGFSIRFDYFRVISYEKKELSVVDTLGFLYLNDFNLVVKRGKFGEDDLKYIIKKQIKIKDKIAWDGYLYRSHIIHGSAQEQVYIEYQENNKIIILFKKWGEVHTYIHVNNR